MFNFLRYHFIKRYVYPLTFITVSLNIVINVDEFMPFDFESEGLATCIYIVSDNLWT